MLVDYHCHVLAGLDDGAKTPAISCEMLRRLKAQGVAVAVATPHFYAHLQNSVTDFLAQRAAAYACIAERAEEFPAMRFGAEVSLEHGISTLPDIEKLCISGTNLILLEIPYTGFNGWMLEEIDHFRYGLHLQPMIAHPHRYCRIVSQADMEKILSIDAVFQINAEAYRSMAERKIVRQLVQEERSLVFGTDAHNLTDRAPNFHVLTRSPRRAAMVEAAGALLTRHAVTYHT